MKRAKRVEAWAGVRADGSVEQLALARSVVVRSPYHLPKDGVVRLQEIRPGERIVGPEEARVLRALRRVAKAANRYVYKSMSYRALMDIERALAALKKGKAGR